MSPWARMLLIPIGLVVATTAYLLLAYKVRRWFRWDIDEGLYAVIVVALAGFLLYPFL